MKTLVLFLIIFCVLCGFAALGGLLGLIWTENPIAYKVLATSASLGLTSLGGLYALAQIFGKRDNATPYVQETEKKQRASK